MDDLSTLLKNVKFFPRDVIGKQPKKVGDKFRALFFGYVMTWEVHIHGGDWFMCRRVGQ